jgi:hypothetical protein
MIAASGLIIKHGELTWFIVNNIILWGAQSSFEYWQGHHHAQGDWNLQSL